MDILFKIFTPRKVIFLIFLLLTASLWRRYGFHLIARYDDWRYPPVGHAAASGQDISAQLERNQALLVTAKYQQISALLDTAQKQGFPIDGLREKTDAALALNVSAYRRQALRLLSEVEFSIPQKKP
ncbi:MAG: hypothetical protein ACYCPQ_10295 [Elusimicrobiota bacterium]